MAKTLPPEPATQTEETPEALEGVSWAAWWKDDAEVVLRSRVSAHWLYRQSDDAAEGRRMAAPNTTTTTCS